MTPERGSALARCRVLAAMLWAVASSATALGAQSRHIVINIPAYRLEAYEGDSVVRTARIAVGMPGYRSPRGTFAISSVDWNPRWIPPDRPWAAKEKPMAPGPANPMGRVKLNFEPLYFLHGTPLVASIGSAASHGCIRMANEDAVTLALFVLGADSARVADSTDGVIPPEDGRTRRVALERPVPLELRYDLVEVRGDDLAVYRDIYGLATRPLRADVYAALAARGVDTLSLDSARVRAAVRGVPRQGRVVAIDSLHTTVTTRREFPYLRQGVSLTVWSPRRR